MKTHPAIIAASIAGGGFGAATGFMTGGEELENLGASELHQLGGAMADGTVHGVVGAGITGTAVALRKILRK